MTLPRRRRGSPIESITLKIAFRADRATAAAVKEVVPSAVVRGGSCVFSIQGSEPGEVADKAKAVLEIIRGMAGHSKRL